MAPEKLQERKVRARKLSRELRKHFPNAKLALKYRTHWQLMVAVQLSAQSTDKKVNEILPGIFKRYKNIQTFADSNLQELQQALSSVLYYKNKARNLQSAARMIIAEFGGRLPKTMEEMLAIPGVARKTANVLLGTLFGINEGIVVDTHMMRFARRFDLTDHKDPVRIERDLMEIIPKKEWYTFTYPIIEYGRLWGNPRGKRHLHEEDPLLAIHPAAKGCWP